MMFTVWAMQISLIILLLQLVIVDRKSVIVRSAGFYSCYCMPAGIKLKPMTSVVEDST